MACSELVIFRGGLVADWAVVSRLLDIEDRGCLFRLEDGRRFRVLPPERLTADDVRFLKARRDEARAVIEYSEKMTAAPAC
jgi:hypothetical protein